ncbi:16S rRNA (guanine(966)-N(2))-methyltransferase RsmD [Rickettsiales endosymbiont of Stachyamoeba lipophora]|uniref:16S rRNA (guanine(966)-N(2))-methyltransferase RsmD n=1 Tax=Rickettsiales endosymbiont of Stachyamoeba lipophora TaxID=2486578 RepID=UPI000F652F66|nr:16S rRNA (guanine(966)-N(2))-methyltransferase RsmD [Rickettsiales endosymbiont of Stachyamoeba lipophora]AZL16280.1 16S rRNA (guanine(966)-N(2))-methyltransferase RsmD [Rickettsiales endosymbiont of Stachyamoeba lipophora]
MRIITGIHRAKPILSDEKRNIRPTTGKIKEAIFNIISSKIGSFTGLNILDLCAGSGNLGLEALSRGAEYVLFIDNNPNALRFIRQNITNFKEGNKAEIAHLDVANLPASIKRFNIIFFDPPYDQSNNLIKKTLERLISRNWLAEDAILIIESGPHYNTEELTPILNKFEVKNYSNTKLIIKDFGIDE